MMNLNKFVGAGVALASSTLVLNATLSAAPAQAFSLTPGSVLNISGPSILQNGTALAPVTDKITFHAGTVSPGTTTGSFAGLINTTAVLSNIALSNPTPGSPQPGKTIRNYNGTVLGGLSNPNLFITLANGWKFDITAPFQVEREASNVGGIRALTSIPQLFGKFYDNTGAVGATGIFTVNSVRKDGSYSATLVAVPEPFTILGTATALGFGAFLKNKKKKEDKASA
jgi:hypothetical protein